MSGERRLVDISKLVIGEPEHHTGADSTVPNHLASDCDKYPSCPLRPQPAREAEAVTEPNVDPLTTVRLIIQTGIADDNLDEIIGMIRRRKDLLAAEKVATLAEGDEIYLVDEIKPKLLAHAKCRIKAFLPNGKIEVTLLEDRGAERRWRYGNTVTIFRSHVGERV